MSLLPGLDTCWEADNGWGVYDSVQCPDAWWWIIDGDGANPGVNQFFSIWVVGSAFLFALSLVFFAAMTAYAVEAGIRTPDFWSTRSDNRFGTIMKCVLGSLLWPLALTAAFAAAAWFATIVLLRVPARLAYKATPGARYDAERAARKAEIDKRAQLLTDARKLLADNDDDELPVTRAMLDDCVKALEKL